MYLLQLIWYANYQREYQLFMDENQASLQFLFLKDWSYDYTNPVQENRFPYSVYTPQQVNDYVAFTVNSLVIPKFIEITVDLLKEKYKL